MACLRGKDLLATKLENSDPVEGGNVSGQVVSGSCGHQWSDPRLRSSLDTGFRW